MKKNSYILPHTAKNLTFLSRRDALKFKKLLKRVSGSEKALSIEQQVALAAAESERRWKNRPRLLGYPAELPIIKYKEAIIESLKTHRVTIVAADTGSGKSTQLPKFCLEAGFGRHGKIVMVQPRRLGVMSVAARIAGEMGESIGRSIGYRIRFDDKSSRQNFIELMTDGMLLSLLQKDKLLLDYDVVIIDEAHERSLNIDLLLGLLLMLLKKRPSLRIVVSSATLDTEKFSKFFHDAPIITAEGRMFPVEVIYRPAAAKSDADRVQLALEAVTEILELSHNGDILVFFPTEDDIKQFIKALPALPTKEKLIGLPLFARLTSGEQKRIFEHYNGRKIIAGTNIAETTLTIPGIRFVIDSGFARISQYNSISRLQTLPISPVSKASANQRMGRAGRTAEGVCFRLYSEEDFNARPDFTPPEIQRANLTETVLRMLALEIHDIENFPFIDQPKSRFFTEAFKTLNELNALVSLKEKPLTLSKTGRFMAHLPIDPRLSRILLEAVSQGCLEEALTVTSALAIQDMRERPAENSATADRQHAVFSDTGSDFLFYINLYKAAAAEKKKSLSALRRFCKTSFLNYNRVKDWLALREQLTTLLKEKGLALSSAAAKSWKAEKAGFGEGYTALHKAILSGYLSQFAFLAPKNDGKSKTNRRNNAYKLANNREGLIFPGSSLWNKEWPWVLSAVIQKTSNVYLRSNAAFAFDWLTELAGHLISYRPEKPHWSKRKKEVVCVKKGLLFGITLNTGQTAAYKEYNKEEAAEIFINEVLLAEPPDPDFIEHFEFLQKNHALKAQIESLRHKLRRQDILAGNDTLALFYKERLADKGVSGFTDLENYIKTYTDSNLYFKESDLILNSPQFMADDYPEEMTLNGKSFPVEYRFALGDSSDGYSLKLQAEDIKTLETAETAWGPEAFLRQRIEAIIRALPKNERIKFHPVAAASEEIARKMDRSMPFFEALRCYAEQHYRAFIEKTVWQLAESKIENYLRPRFTLLNGDGSEALSSRNIAELKKARPIGIEKEVLNKIKTRENFEKINLKTFPAEEIPLSVTLYNNKILAGTAYPALYAHDGTIDLKLFNTLDEAAEAHPSGVAELIGNIYRKELNSLKKSLETPHNLEGLAYFGGSRRFDRLWWDLFLKRHLMLNYRTRDDWRYAASADFIKTIWETAEKEKKAVELSLKLFSDLRGLISRLKNKYQHLHKFWAFTEHESVLLFDENMWPCHNTDFILNLPRFIKSLITCIERSVADPAKTLQKVSSLSAVENAVLAYGKAANSHASQRIYGEALYLLAELKVKTFTPEIAAGKKSSEAAIYALLNTPL
jgi:ATP-dependent helicase HrpA